MEGGLCNLQEKLDWCFNKSEESVLVMDRVEFVLVLTLEVGYLMDHLICTQECIYSFHVSILRHRVVQDYVVELTAYNHV